MSMGICEEIWLQKELLNLHQECETPMTLFYDGKAAISIANNLVQLDRTKDVEIGRHFIKERLDSGSICIPYIPWSQRVADVLTHGLLRPKFNFCVSKYGAIVMDDQNSDGSIGYTVLHNCSCQHSAPTFINIVNAAILRLATGDQNMTIQTRNHPLPMTKSQRLQRHDLDAFSAAIIINIAFCFIPASFAVSLVKERETKAKHQQMISGVRHLFFFSIFVKSISLTGLQTTLCYQVSMLSYWISTYLWDAISFLVPTCLALVLFYIFGMDQFIGKGRFLATAIIFLEYGLAIASSTYCLTFFFLDHTVAQNVVLSVHFFTGLVLMVISFIMGLIETMAKTNSFLKNFFRISPGFCFADGLASLALLRQGMKDKTSEGVYDWNVTGASICYLGIQFLCYFLLTLGLELLPLHKLTAITVKEWWMKCWRNNLINLKAETSSPSLEPFLAPSSNYVIPDFDLDVDVAAERNRVLSGSIDNAIIYLSNLRKNLQKPPIYPTGVVPQPYAPPFDQKLIHAPLVSGAWAHAPPPFHVTAHPVPFYAPSDVQPSNPSGHPHPHAPSTSSGQHPSTVNLSNQYSKQQLYVDPLQQPLFSGNGIDQPQNRSDIEAGESSTHSKPTELPMYSKNPVTSFPNSQSNYITGSLGSSTGNFSGEKLNGQNYFSWSQSIKMFLEGRYQFGFLTGEIVRPPPGDALERLWKGEDSLIRSMLINSMEPQIGKPLLYATTAKDLWDTTQTLYSKRQNASRLYTLRKQVHNCKQGTLDVTTYFNKLSLLWQEMDLCRETVWDTPNDSTQYAKLEEADRVYDFLAGLNPKFDNVCGRILGQRPLPSLMEVCFEVRLEEDRTNAMGVLTTPTIDSAAFSARSSNHDSDKNNGKSIPVCEHCKKQWHTKDQCWKLHGRPPGGKKRSSNEKQNSGRAYISETTPASTSQSTDPTVSQTKTPTLGAIAQSGMPQSLGLISVDGKNPWILDSGATDHLTGSSEHFISYAPCAGNEKIRIADGSLAPIAGKGQIVPFDGFALQNVLHVPKLSYNLLSISKITRELHCKAIFLPESVYFQDMSSGRTIGTARHSRGLYILDDDTSCSSLSRVSLLSSYFSTSEQDCMLWHFRLGHPNFTYMQHLFPHLFSKVDVSSLSCDVCIRAKQHRVSFPSQPYKPTQPFNLIHSDVWGPSKVTTSSGKRWFVTFIDDHTRLTWVYLISDKSEVPSIFQNFYHTIKTQFHTKIAILRSDNGREFQNHNLSEFLASKGIVHQTSCAYTPQQNGVAERKNRHLVEVARSLMLSTSLPSYLWGDAILTAAHLINRMPSRILHLQTPLDCLKESYPSTRLVSEVPLRVFGCTAYVHNFGPNQTKFTPRAQACVFVGYPLHQHGYKCFHPPSRKYFVTMDVTFCENRPYFPVSHLQGENVSEESNNTFEFVEPTLITVSDIDPHPIILPTNQVPWKTYYRRNLRKEVGSPTSQPPAPVQNFEPPRDQGMENPTKPCTNNTMSENDKSDIAFLENMEEKNCDDETEVRIETSNDEAEQGHTRKLDEYDPSLDIPIALRKGTRSCTKHPICNYVSYDNLSPQFRAFTANLDSTIIPKNIYTALECPEWKNAVMEEMKALEKNRTWEICALPKGHKTVGCKWVFSLKYKADGTLDRHKARLVAKGFTQTYGIDYSETFSPVAKLNTVRVLLSVAVNKDWPLYQLDVKNAFLNGDLVEEVYMSPPPGFEAQFGQEVCKLQKSLYGLKQSPRAWFDRFTTFVKSQGYSQGHSDHTLFTKASKTGKIAILIVYVDDIVLTGDDQTEISQLKQRMGDEFEIKDLGNLKYFLGMEVARSKEGISVSQRKYTLDLLTETGMLGCRPADTPIEFNCKLGNSDDQVPVDKEQYQRLVGKLIYLSHTRPDISFAVSVVSQFMQAPYEKHMEAVNRILRYLKNTPGKGLMFRKTNRKTIEAYTDSDWAGSVIDRKSTSGYCTFVWGNLVTWRSKKQSVVARSSAEAEYRAMSLGICEEIWLQKVLSDLHQECETPLKLFCDNKAAISIANNPVQHDRTKHVEIDRHFIKERLDSGSICIPYIPSSQQIADVLTKGLLRPHFDLCVSKLGLIDIYLPT
ncbi:Beta-galactosidase [Cucumis melo var. makuwa]|uniref:Beta-galactosidase n=5 Tax=Cucumis melo var. makuwa TaxID=1194695 RepID=A0A5D3CLI4_CUCMM|nr:Beta-galactosidase [Cucumis melo var. makuwa]